MSARRNDDIPAPQHLTPHERKLWRQRKPRSVEETVARRCLSCQSAFPSKWPGNRICADCRDTDQWRGSGFEEYGVSK